MDALKPKSLKTIEEKMAGLSQDTLRYHILESAKNFKTSWVELGRSLYSVWKDKHYKEWGYSNFDLYASKEIGIRKQTAMKLLRSYFFLEKEEPEYLKAEFMVSQDTAALPSYESIDLLRLARNKKTLDSHDYHRLKKEVFEKGKDAHEVKRDLTALIRERQELEPEEAYQKRRLSTIKRFLGTLKSLKQELEISKLLPAEIIREASSLIGKLEAEVN
ncbi:MAG TPA: hypothetical protein VMD04_01600 [Candidatus Margulisiibacteriota bacterium]|nr:hypothetical protein [Candidatus Margulisiibacteriota bacterium]